MKQSKPKHLSTSRKSAERKLLSSGPSPFTLVAVTLLMGGLFLAVMPIRTYLSQHKTLNTVSSQLRDAQARNAQLTAEISQLNSPDQIAQIARTRFGLVQPGQQSFVILPPSSPGDQLGSVPAGAALVGAVPASVAPTNTIASPTAKPTKPTVQTRPPSSSESSTTSTSVTH